jgi:hypothetical protein
MAKASGIGEGSANGSSEGVRVGNSIYAALISTGLDEKRAASFALFCQDVYSYVQNDPKLQAALDTYSVYDGSKKSVVAAGYIQRAGALGLKSGISGFSDYGKSGGAAVLGVFVDRFGAYAKSQGIELNECSLTLAKVALDVGGAGTGAVTALSGWGLLLAGVSVVATFKDSYSLAKVCFPGK